MVTIPELTDSRRLTGANLYWDLPAAIIDCSADAPLSEFINSWERAASQLLDCVGHGGEQLTHRAFEGGASLLISAPVDALYSMCELNEAAFAAAVHAVENGPPPDLDSEASRLAELFREEANPALLALQQAAREHQAPFLWDDDHVSVGFGATAKVWTPHTLPGPADVDWDAAGDVPVALITGTNGKSTTVRMAAAIIAAAGKCAGLTSTDWIRVGETILDTGDYSGTGGARTLLRHPDTELAVLETARGGLLRRGLAVESAAAAVITNVAADHLGDYGINSVPELIEAKFIVRRALPAGAPLILNADDPGMVDFAARLDNTLLWFSLDPDNPVVTAHLARGGQAAVLRHGWLELMQGETAKAIITSSQIPACLDGAARHNIRNALAAMALCHVLGFEDADLRAGLASFQGDEKDNPGRSNWFEKDGVRILVDFAHNEHGVLALADMLSRLPAERRVLLMSQAGDRLDRDITDMIRAGCQIEPDRMLICELPGYERGRDEGEVPALIREAAIDAGISPADIEVFPSPREAVSAALGNAQPGDLLVLLVLTQREEALGLIDEFLRQA